MSTRDSTLQRASVQSTDRVYTPRADLLVGDTSVVVEVDLPGVPHDGLEVDAHAGQLRIEGRRTAGVVYRRVFRVPDGIDTEKITAELRNGVLSVTLPKAAAHVPRRISVR